MGDEKGGPYKIVQRVVTYREPLKYSIVVQGKHDAFQQEVIPDAGSGETARLVCNLLNQNHRNKEIEISGGIHDNIEEEVGSDEAGRGGLDNQIQSADRA